MCRTTSFMIYFRFQAVLLAVCHWRQQCRNETLVKKANKLFAQKPHYINICSLNRSKRLHLKCERQYRANVTKIEDRENATTTEMLMLTKPYKIREISKIFLIWHVTTLSVHIFALMCRSNTFEIDVVSWNFDVCFVDSTDKQDWTMVAMGNHSKLLSIFCYRELLRRILLRW